MRKQANYKIGIYIRVSTQEQADNPEGSIRNQKDRLEQMVKLKNLQENFGEIVGVFIDEAKSGKDTNRPELKRMLREIESGKINLVMASELSRISRNIQDFAKIWNMMKEKECSFFSLRENFDTTTAAGEMVLYMMANLSQFERRQVSERVSANFLARAKRGLFNGGSMPPGFKIIPDKPGYLQIDEEEAPTIKKCFEYYQVEETLAATAKRLNRENYQLQGKMSGGRPRLKHFSVENLYRVLTNPVMAGLKTYTENGEVHKVKAVWNGIVSEKVFHETAKRLKDNKHFKKGHSKKRYPYILSGLVYCSECGDKLTGKSAHGKGGKVGYYEHGWRYRKNFCKTEKMHTCEAPTRFNAERVHKLIIDKVTELLSDQESAKELLSRASKVSKKDPIKADIKRYQNRRINVDRKLEILTERLTELPKELSANSIYKKMEVLQTQKKELDELIESKKRELKGALDSVVDLDDWNKFLKLFNELFTRHLNVEQQTKLIKKLIYRIELGSKDVKIHYFVGENLIKKGLAELSAGPLFLFPEFGSNNLTNGGFVGYRTNPISCVRYANNIANWSGFQSRSRRKKLSLKSLLSTGFLPRFHLFFKFLRVFFDLIPSIF